MVLALVAVQSTAWPSPKGSGAVAAESRSPPSQEEELRNEDLGGWKTLEVFQLSCK